MSSLDDKFIVITQRGEENTILNWNDFNGRTVLEILNKYFPDKQNLSFSNNLYSELLDKSQNPSELYPELALTDYPDEYLKPQNYLSIIENDFDFSIKFQVICQEREPKIKFPPLDIFFKKSKFSNCGDIFKYVSEKFTLPHLDDKFFQNSIEISPDMSSNDFFEASKKSPIYFHTTLTDAAIRKISYRQNILKEIISTETTYINDLRALLDYWKPGMKRSNYFTDQEISFFFGDLPDILKLHAKFKKSLEERGTEFDTFISDIFIKFSRLFIISKRFISTYAIFTYILNEKSETNKNSSSILLNLSKANTFEEGRDFTSYLITPVQRMPRYILFLRELSKYSPIEHPDFPYIEKAMNSIVSVTQEIDLFSNSSRQIAHIMSNFSKPLFIFKEGRSLIESVTVYVNQSSTPFDQYSTGTMQNANAPKEGYFYLFNDSVLMTTIDQISSPKSKDSRDEFPKYPENPLFHKEFNEFKYFPHQDSIEFSFKDKRAKKGVNHFLVYFKKRTDCIEFLGKIEEQRMKTKNIDVDDPWIIWKNRYFDLRPKISSKPLNKPIKFAKILPSAYNQGTSSTFSETSEIFHFFFGGELRDKANGQLVSIKEDGNGLIEIDSIENNSPNIHARLGHSFCSDGTFLYVFGGKKSNSEFYDDTWRYHPDTQKWELLTPHQNKPSKRAFHAACFCSLKNNKKVITVFGGLGEKKKPLDDIAMFDVDTCEWTVYDLFNAPNPRYLMGCTVCNETQFIIVGGRDERYIFNDVYSFDLDHKMWKKIVITGETVFPRFGHQVVAIGDWAVSIGGSAFEEIFIDKNSSRSKKNKSNSPSKKNSFTFSSLPPAAVNIKTGNSFNIDEFGNAPQSLIGFGVVKLRNNTNDNVSSFLAFGGLEDGINASRNSWFTIEIPNNLTQLIEGSKNIETENTVEKQQTEIQLPVNNQVISNTEEMIHVNLGEKFNDEIERQNLLIINENKKNETNKENEAEMKQQEIAEKTNLPENNENNEDNEDEAKLNNTNEDETKINQIEDQTKINQTIEEKIEQNKTTEEETKLNKENEEEIKLNKENEEETKLNKENEEETKLNKENEEETKFNKENEEETKLNKENEEETKLNKENEEETKLNKENEEETKPNKSNEEETKLNKDNEEETKPNKSNEEETKLNKDNEEETKLNKENEEEFKPNKSEETILSEAEEQKVEHEIPIESNKDLFITNNDNNKQETEEKENQEEADSTIRQETVKTENEFEGIERSQIQQQEENNQVDVSNEQTENKQQTIEANEVQKEGENNQKDEIIQQNQKEPIEIEQTQTKQEQDQNQKDESKINIEQEKQITPNQPEIKLDIDQKENQSEDEKKQRIQDQKDHLNDEKHELQNQDQKDNNMNEKLKQQDQEETDLKENETQDQKENDLSEKQNKDQKNNNLNEIKIEDQKDNVINENLQLQINDDDNNENNNDANEKEIQDQKDKNKIEDLKQQNQKEIQDQKDNNMNEDLKQQDQKDRNLNQKNKNTNEAKGQQNQKFNKTNQNQKQQVQKSLGTQQKTQIQKKQPMRKSIDPKSNLTNTQQKKPIQKQTQTQKQNDKQQPKPAQRYQKRQTLDPKSSTKTNVVKRTNQQQNTKQTQQNNSARRKTTHYGNQMLTRTSNTTTTKQVNQIKKTQNTPRQNSPQKQNSPKQNSPRQLTPVIESIFNFQKVISMKLTTIHSNSIGKPTLENPAVLSPPSISEADSTFCIQAGIDVTKLDIFGKKLVLRRLRKAIEEGTGSNQTVRKLKSAFLVSVGETVSCSEIGVDESVSMLATRMQAVTDKSGESLFLCQLETPFDVFKKIVMEKTDE